MSHDPKTAGAVPRLSKVGTVGSLLAGLAIIVAGGALIDSDLALDHRALSFIGLSVGVQEVAAAIIVIALTVIGLNLRSALSLLHPSSVAGGAPVEVAKTRQRGPGGPLRSLTTGIETSSLVALKLVEPGPALSPSDMELMEAVRCAFRETQTSAAASFATAVANHPDDIVKMYATFIAEQVPIFGCRGELVEKISLGAPLKEFLVEDGQLVLKERDGSEIYRHLRIRADELGVVIQRLKTLSSF